jgi:hypothetical protein
VDHAKILGLKVSNSLQWNLHVERVIKKANKRLYCLVQLKRANVLEAELNFYCTCIRPTLEYASQVFHHSLPKYLSHDDLERVQKALCTAASQNKYKVK